MVPLVGRSPIAFPAAQTPIYPYCTSTSERCDPINIFL